MNDALHSAENDALPTVYVMVENVAHVMIPPDVDDLGWSCSQRAHPGMPQCRWRASEAFSTPDRRKTSFVEHHLPPGLASGGETS